MDSPAQSSLTARARSRTGVALFAALMLLGLIALLLGAALASFRLAARSSGFATTDAVLTAAADYALTSVVSSARQLGLDTLPIGVAQTIVPSMPPSTTVIPIVVATRLTGGVVWLVADVAEGGLADGHRRINLVARWRAPGPPPPSALVARGGVRVAAGVTFSVDSSGDADCRFTPASAVTIAPGAVVTSAGGVSAAVSLSSADSSKFFLAPAQIAQLAGGVGVVHVAGDTTITGSFSGVLIVDGMLIIDGPFTATGLLVSRGPVVALGGGLSVTGALLSFAAPIGGQPAIDLGPAAIRYSGCAIAAALRRAVPLRPVRERSWAELF